MTTLKMSWRGEETGLANEWVEAEATVPYSPAWMLSSYPREANAQRSRINQSPLSPFGKTALIRSLVRTSPPAACFTR